MTSDKKRAANQRNSKLSKGPTSDRGKWHASLNALKLGLYAQTLILPGENNREYEQLACDVRDAIRPQGIFEHMIVDLIVRTLWRIRRLDYAEYAFLMRLLKLQVMDRKFEVRESLMSINGKKVRSDAETEKLLRNEAKRLRPSIGDLKNVLRTLAESELERLEKVERCRQSLVWSVLRLLAALDTMQERRLTLDGATDDSSTMGLRSHSGPSRRAATRGLRTVLGLQGDNSGS